MKSFVFFFLVVVLITGMITGAPHPGRPGSGIYTAVFSQLVRLVE